MAPSVTVGFWAPDDINNATPIVTLTDEDEVFKGLKLKPDLYGLGGWELTVARQWGYQLLGDDNIRPEVFVRFLVHAWSDTDWWYGGVLQKRVQDVVNREESGAEEYILGGPGPKAYMERYRLGITQNVGEGLNLNLDNGVWHFQETATAGRILAKVIAEDEAATPEALTDMTQSFTAALDSDGVDWANEIAGPGTYRIPIGTSLLEVIWDLEDLSDLFTVINLGTVAAPTYELEAFQDYGTDVSGSSFGSGVGLLREGVNITNDSLEVHGVGLRRCTHVIVEGKDGAWATNVVSAWSPGDYVKWGKIEYTRSSNINVLERAGLRWLRRQQNGDQQITVEILPGASEATGLYFPGPGEVIWLGNTISLDTQADGTTHSPLDYNNADQLVTGIELTLGPAGDDSTADKAAKSWDIKLKLNHERAGFAGSPDQTSAATGKGCNCAPQTATPPPIITDGTWKALSLSYRDGGGSIVVVNAEPAGWDDIGFDDSAWDTAAVDSTREWADLIHHPDASAMRRSELYLMRKEFWIEPGELTGDDVFFRYLFDDGGKVFINGVEVASYNTPFDSAATPVPTHDDTLVRATFVEGWNAVGIYAWNTNTGTNGSTPPGPTSAGLVIAIDTGLGSGDGLPSPDTHSHHAADLPYDNGDSGLTADDVQEAIDELASGGGGGGGGHTIENSGTPLTARTGLNFVAPLAATDDAGNDETDVGVDIAEDGDISTQAFGDSPAAGANTTEVAMAGHKHGMPANPVTAHEADTTDAHDASAISAADAGGYWTGSDVEAILQEIGAGGAGGGGGNVSTFSASVIDYGAVQLLKRRAATNTEEDLFNAGSLDAKWSHINGSAPTFGLPGWILLPAACAIQQAVPAGDWTIETEILYQDHQAAVFSKAGLLLSNSATITGTQRQYFIGMNNSLTTAWSTLLQNFTNGVAVSNTLTGPSIDPFFPLHHFIRIIKSGTTYACEISFNGITWQRWGSTAALGITPTHFGIAALGSGGPGAYFNSFHRY